MVKWLECLTVVRKVVGSSSETKGFQMLVQRHDGALKLHCLKQPLGYGHLYLFYLINSLEV